VQLRVRGDHRGFVVGVEREAAAVADLLQLGQVGRLDAGGGQGGCLALQRGSDREHLVDLVVGRPPYERAPSRPQLHPALGLQRLERLAHRPSADVEPDRQLRLHEMLPG
jgi:hypothetical protein